MRILDNMYRIVYSKHGSGCTVPLSISIHVCYLRLLSLRLRHQQVTYTLKAKRVLPVQYILSDHKKAQEGMGYKRKKEENITIGYYQKE